MTDLSLTQQRSITDAYLRMCESANDTAYETAVREYAELLRKQNADYERYETLQSEISQKFNEPFIKVGLGNVDRFGNKEFSDLHRKLKGIGSNEMDRYVSTYGNRIEFDALYLDAVERKDMETCKRMVADAASRSGYDIPLWRVDSNPNHGTSYSGVSVYFATSLGYYEKSNTGYSSSDAKPFVLNSHARIFDPMRELNAQPITWSNITMKVADLDRLGIEDEGDTEEGEEYGVTSTEGLANCGKRNGFDATLLREIPNDGGWGKPYDEYAVHNSSAVKSLEPVIYDDDGQVILPTRRFDSSNPDIRY